MVVDCQNLIWVDYFKKYGLSSKLKLGNNKELSEKINFPHQPAENSNDCGVLVCINIWMMITGEAFPVNLSAQIEGNQTFFLVTKNANWESYYDYQVVIINFKQPVALENFTCFF